jgi:hypothetical protein
VGSLHRFTRYRYQLPAIDRFLYCGLLLCVLVSCQPAPKPIPPFGAVADLPTFDAREDTALCADLDNAWGKDWPTVIDSLEKLRLRQGQCNGENVAPKLYPAYFNYGAALEVRGKLDDAIRAYQNALAVNPQGSEAAVALKKHNMLMPVALTTCSTQQVNAALSAVPIYIPQGSGDFIVIQGDKFVLNGQPYLVRGINYYPVRAPWRRFLTDTDLTVVERELDLIRDAKFNTLRIFLHYESMFNCPGNGAVPRPQAFARLDGVIARAAARGFHLLVTLNDLPDLTIRPMYLYPAVADAQTAYIIKRYRDESTILGWDVRNEGDIDYTRHGFSATVVLDWLANTTSAVRQMDSRHLITAGWLDGAQATAKYVDFLSFHHWSISLALQARVTAFRTYTHKPILIEETGVSTIGGNEAQQVEMLKEVIGTADRLGLAGWMIWTAFDFPTDATCIPPACPSIDNGEHHFGLWRTDYRPKPAVEIFK